MLSSGLLIAERYRLDRRVAVGGMGEVWDSNDTRLDRRVAVKVLKDELSGDAEFLHRFRTEARMTASLNHPGIAGVHDYGETVAGEHSIAFLVMEFVEGDPLAAILVREGRISPERTLDLLEQAGHALQAAHESGLVHRDIKPGNILVTASGTVKVTDFGVAKASNAAPVTRSGMVMGTAHYIAPEQAIGHDAAPVSDVYSLAVCGYECLAGRRPFLSDHAVTVAMMHIRDLPPPLPPDVPPGARALIEMTLVKDPAQRYATGGEFANAVAAVRAGLPLPTPSGMALAGYAGQPAQLGQPSQSGQPGQPGQHGPAVPGPGLAPLPPPGTTSHPAMQPVPAGPAGPPGPSMHPTGPPGAVPPGAAIAPVGVRRRRHGGMWILLLLILGLVLAGAVVLIVVLGSDDKGGEPSGRPNNPAPVEDNWPGTKERSSDEDRIQGMMGTPWTEWDGTTQ